MTLKKANAFNLTKNASILTLGLFMMIGASCKKSDTTSDYVGDWVSSADFDGPVRAGAVSFVIGDHAYIATGYQKDLTWLNDNWSYDQNTTTWTQVASMPGVGRTNAVAFTIGTKAYVGTGTSDGGTTFLNDFYSYNTANNTWATIANYAGSARAYAVGFASSTLGYVGTGVDADNAKKDFYSYNPLNDTWAQSSSYSGKARQNASTFTINNVAYLVGGVSSGAYLTDFWAFDLATQTWTLKRPIINISDDSYDDLYGSATGGIPRSNATAFVMNGIGFLATGYNSGILATVWAYDPGADQWTEKTSLEATARMDAVSFVIGGRGFLGTGQTGTIRLGDFWEFLPNNTQVDNN